jgi:predicted XRE-type DNA-binding protein
MSHSVFHDLYDTETANLMVIKANILMEIEKIVKENNISRRDLEKILDVPQPQISELMTKKLSKISFDRMLTYLNRLIKSVNTDYIIKIVISTDAT